MAYGSEEYYRPRYRGADDIVSLMSNATSDAVNTINRTGENVARSYGERPKLLGDAVKGFADSYRASQDRVRRQELEDERRKQLSEEHALSMKTGNQSADLNDIKLKAARSEEDWFNTPYGDASAGPTMPGKGMSRRDIQREQGMKMGELGLTGAEENIKTSQVQRENSTKSLEAQIAAAKAAQGAAAAAQARADKMFQMQLDEYKQSKAAAAIGAALSQDTQAPVQNPTVGPPQPSRLDQVTGEYGKQGMDPITLATLTTQQRGAAAKNAKEQSLLDRKIDPALASQQDQLTNLAQKMPALTQLAGATQAFKGIPALQSGTNEAQTAKTALQQAIQGASLDPVTGQKLAQSLDGGMLGVNDFSFSKIFAGQNPVQTATDQAQQAALNIISNYEQQIGQLEATAKGTFNKQMMDQAMQMRAQVTALKQQVMGEGGGPQVDTWQPPQAQPRPNMFQPQQQPRTQAAKYDGRG